MAESAAASGRQGRQGRHGRHGRHVGRGKTAEVPVFKLRQEARGEPGVG